MEKTKKRKKNSFCSSIYREIVNKMNMSKIRDFLHKIKLHEKILSYGPIMDPQLSFFSFFRFFQIGKNEKTKKLKLQHSPNYQLIFVWEMHIFLEIPYFWHIHFIYNFPLNWIKEIPFFWHIHVKRCPLILFQEITYFWHIHFIYNFPLNWIKEIPYFWHIHDFI